MNRIPKRSQLQFGKVNRLTGKRKPVGLGSRFGSCGRLRVPQVRARRLGANLGIVIRVRADGITLLHPDAPPQQALKASDQDGQLKWLRQIVIGARSESLQDIFGTPARGQHQDRNVVFLFAQQRGYFEAALARQHHVQNNGIEVLCLLEEAFQSGFAIARDFNLVSFGLQVEAQTLRQVCLVFYHQYAAHATLRGNSRVTVVPFPTPSLWANTLPPWLRAIERTMNNPSPVPFTRERGRWRTR